MQYFYNGTGNNQDIPYAVTVDDSNSIYVTGSSRNGQTLGTEDMVTLKVDPTGLLRWQRRYNGIGGGTDLGICVTVDGLGNCYVGGAADKGDNKLTYAVLKYSPLGSQLWFKDYSVSNTPEDFVYSVSVDDGYNVFVTGISFDSATDYDIATIKYSQPIGITPVSNQIPGSFELCQNYPNPFNPVTHIEFRIPARSAGGSYFGLTELKIYDVTGKEVQQLVNRELSPGVYKVIWDASAYPSGVFFYRLSAGEFTLSRKMTLIK
jgi:hypothetical protein